jgi:TolA-binding protein
VSHVPRMLVLICVGAFVGRTSASSVEPPAQAPGQIPPGLHAQPGLLEEAIQADREGIPEVSINKLRSFLSGKPEPEPAKEAKLLLARCLIETGQADEALALLSGVEFNDADATGLKAQACLRLRRWVSAEDLFRQQLAQEPEPKPDSLLGLAEAQRGSGQLDSALATLRPLIEKNSSLDPQAVLLAAEIGLQRSDVAFAKVLLTRMNAETRRNQFERLCLEGEIALQEQNLDAAQDAFDQVLAAQKDRTGRTIAVAELGLVRVLVAKQEFEEAEAAIEKLISDQSRSLVLPELFEALFEADSNEANPSLSELTRWSQEQPAKTNGPDRPAYALYYLGKLQLKEGLNDKACETWQELLRRFPDHRVAAKGAEELAREKIRVGDFKSAAADLEKVLSSGNNPPELQTLHQLLAQAYMREGNFSAAREVFLDLAKQDKTSSQAALFNAAICDLRLGDESGFEAAFGDLRRTNPAPELLGDLAFEQGLLQAKAANASAEETLQRFVKDFAGHPKIPEAHLILAEIQMTEQPAERAAAKEELKKIQTQDPALGEKVDRLRFFIAASDSNQSAQSLLRLADEFFQKYPTSPVRAEIRLKLGEFYFRQNDYPNAQTQFELVREEQPDSPLVETALFLAGEAARKSLNPTSLDRAITLFEDVYNLGGPLRYQARLEQALTKRQNHQEKEALVLLGDLLNQNPPVEIRYQALDAKGDAEFTLAAQDPTFYDKAIETFDQLLASNNLPLEWKQRALYKKGKSLEKLKKFDDALAAYYDALASQGAGGDQLWFYRSGFDAAQILEDRRAWSSAGAVYEKLANTRGARSAEAKSRLDRLRLEHFLWPE